MRENRSTDKWRAYHKDYFMRRHSTLAAKSTAWTLSQRMANNDFLFAYLSEHPCVDCGESDPVVLEFDHLSPEGKRGCVSTMARSCSAATLRSEVEKCVVRCANCHRRRTAREYGYYRDVRRSPGAVGQGMRKSGADGQTRTGARRFTKPARSSAEQWKLDLD